MKKYLIFGLLAVLVVVSAFFAMSDLSVIGEDVSSDECVINSSLGYCEFELTLPMNRELQDYNLELLFGSVPGPFIDEVQVSPLKSVILYEDDNEHLSSSYEDLQTIWYYTYRIPKAWDVDSIYAIQYDLSMAATVTKSREDSDTEVEAIIGAITMPYTSEDIIICSNSCDNGIIRNYQNSVGERRVSNLNFENLKEIGVETANEDVDTYRDYTLGTTKSGTVIKKGNFVLQDVMDKYGITNPETEFMMMIYAYVDEVEKGYTSGTAAVPPTLYFSYAEKKSPTNTQLSIGNGDVIETYQGSPTSIVTKDLASEINDYCERNSESKTCVIPLRFSSSSIGSIQGVSSEGTLLATVSGSTPSYGGNLITGGAISSFASNSFDFNEHPTQAYITIGLIFVIVLGLIIFLGGSKK